MFRATNARAQARAGTALCGKGSNPSIERAFRDLCEEIARHPYCAGAYTGNKPDAKPENYGSKAIPLEAFRTFVASEIARHNQRSGRRTPAAQGRSFAETFRASLEAPTTLVRRATAEQRRMFLLAAEGVTALKPTGEMHLGDNRYWAEPLRSYADTLTAAQLDIDLVGKTAGAMTQLRMESQLTAQVRADAAKDGVAVTRGDPLPIEVRYAPGGEPMDWTGYTADVTVLLKGGANITLGNDRVTLIAPHDLADDEAPNFIALMTPEETRQLTVNFKLHAYQCRALDPDGNPETVLKGIIDARFSAAADANA